MATLTRTWTSSQNNSCANQTAVKDQTKEILLDMKIKMLAAGWTVTQSSDSVTADASDRWLDVGDLVYDTGIHSWIVLRSPANYPSTGKYIYFGIDYTTTTANYCYFASRGDADWTSLTTSQGPSHSTYDALMNPFDGTINKGIVPTSLADCKFHSSYSDAGDIIYYVSNSTTGYAHFVMLMIKCEDAEATDLFPVVNYVYGKYNPSAGISYSGFYSLSFYNDDYSKGFHPTTGKGSGNKTYGGALDYPNSAVFWKASAASNTGDALTGKIPAVPIAFACEYPSGANRIVGQATDIFACQGYSSTAATYVKAAVGDVAPGTGTITQGVVGGMWVPCSVAPDFT
jgi:hypothetical protein